MMRSLVLFVLLFSFSALAQDDQVARARQLAIAGDRAQALTLLETHLAAKPDDRDARTLYGTVLSWNGDYDRARAELQRVLAADAANADARAALANVVRWSRNEPSRRTITVGADYEDLPSDSWSQLYVSGRVGALIARASHAERGDSDDQQVEVESWPRLGGRSYAHFAAGAATDGVLYPDWHAAAELYHGFSDGYEASAGYRRLAFDDAADIFTASLGRYVGSWYLQGRVYHSGDLSWQALVRNYVGDAGSYVGIRAGSSREEIRSGVDLLSLDDNQFAVEGRWVATSRWTLTGRAGVAALGNGDRFTAGIAVGRGF